MKFLTALLASLILSANLYTQHLNQVIAEGGGLCEPSIFVNPFDTDNIIAGAIIDKYYVSYDGGISWNAGSLSSSLWRLG
jgi:hypothetical protein